MGLLDRLLGKNKQMPAQPAPEDHGRDGEGETEFALPDQPFIAPPPKDQTDQWIPQREQQHTGPAGTIRPLTTSAPVAIDQQAKIESPTQPVSEPRVVEPASEQQIDELHAKAMRGHSYRDIEALWDAILSKPELHILQRGRANKVEAHAVESPIGPMLLAFTAKFRIQALTATKPYQNTPFVWSVATMATDRALEWMIDQRKAGVQAVEFNRGVHPGLAGILQSVPARYERVHGRRLGNAHLVSPDFGMLASRISIEASQQNIEAAIEQFCRLQRWYALRDPKRPNQPAFTPIQDQPTLMLFTSEAEAHDAAVVSGREKEWPKLLMTIEPAKLVQWMVTLPSMGASATIINHANTPFAIDLSLMGEYWSRFASGSGVGTR